MIGLGRALAALSILWAAVTATEALPLVLDLPVVLVAVPLFLLAVGSFDPLDAER